MKIQVINKSKHALPEYATGQSAGMDIRANLDEPIVLKPLQRCLRAQLMPIIVVKFVLSWSICHLRIL